MKLWSNYCKELKIASRGFYFYVELFTAVLLLVVLLFLVPERPTFRVKEVIYPQMSAQQFDELIQQEVGKGYNERIADTEIKLKPAVLTYFDENTGEPFEKTFTDKKTITVKTYLSYDSETGDNTKIKYFTNNFDDMMRVAYAKKYIGTHMWFGDDGQDYYKNVLFGSETQRYKNLVASAHGNVDMQDLLTQFDSQNVRLLGTPQTLNFRQNIIPAAIVMLNGLMGMMVIIAYLSVDKSEGILKAMAVSPFQLDGYLFSKILVVLTTALCSVLIVVIPVMRFQPSYPLLLISCISLTILSCTIGLFISTYFKDLKSAFGVLLILIIPLMLPILTFFIPSFSPAWMKFLPTYSMIEAIKETLLVETDLGFVLLSNLGMLIASVLLFFLAQKRYKKILGI